MMIEPPEMARGRVVRTRDDLRDRQVSAVRAPGGGEAVRPARIMSLEERVFPFCVNGVLERPCPHEVVSYAYKAWRGHPCVVQSHGVFFVEPSERSQIALYLLVVAGLP